MRSAGIGVFAMGENPALQQLIAIVRYRKRIQRTGPLESLSFETLFPLTGFRRTGRYKVREPERAPKAARCSPPSRLRAASAGTRLYGCSREALGVKLLRRDLFGDAPAQDSNAFLDSGG